MAEPAIPVEALDDRLGIVGTSGSGKTYGAGTAVERILAQHCRVIVIDPLGVWWGLRLKADGKTASVFDVVIFGGAHGDIAINEHAGAVIGETVAGMSESAIIDLSGLGTKAAERRFMLAFLKALNRKASGEPVHLVIDEADLFAPQQIRDREQEPAKLLGMMETIVRRGRVKGFIPWLITQRPAVINKDVLSQVDALIAFKLTSSQDRAALGGWIEGQADREQGRKILASLPALARGRAVVWVPGRSILGTEQFPAKATFDSSRTPKRGEKRQAAELKPLDLGALKDRLASVVAETEANDPNNLKKRILQLERHLRDAKREGGGASQEEVDIACRAAAERATTRAVADMRKGLGTVRKALEAGQGAIMTALESLDLADLGTVEVVAQEPRNFSPPQKRSQKLTLAPPPAKKPARNIPENIPSAGITRPQQRILDALAWLEAIGQPQGTRAQVAFLADQSPKSSGYTNNLGSMRTAGMIDYPAGGMLCLTEYGRDKAQGPAQPPSISELHEAVLGKLPRPQQRIVDTLIGIWPDSMNRADLAEAAEQSITSSGYSNNLGALRSLGLLDYPAPGQVVAQLMLFPDVR